MALAAQGLAAARPRGRVQRGHVAAVFERLGTIQIDSVNVLVRSHYLPLYARLGAYDTGLLDRMAWGRRGRALFEYWAHEASLLDVAMHPLFRWRMARAKEGEGTYSGMMAFRAENRAYIGKVLAEVAERGPLGVSDLSDGGAKTGPWWGWSKGKTALEWLFWAGQVSTAKRRGFERLYDLTERVIPPEILALPTPAPEDAQRALVMRAVRALGIATEAEIRDYFRLPPEDNRARLRELLEAGAVEVARVKGWSQRAYLDATAPAPRRVRARALLSPFDSLVWNRDRAERLFDFHYRIGLYTPKAKRVHGYYVLPFLLGERLAARVDLKADRAAGVLCVQGVHAEPGADLGPTAEALAEELGAMAAWRGLEHIGIAARGDLAPALLQAMPEAHRRDDEVA
jgi:hypothetical protein